MHNELLTAAYSSILPIEYIIFLIYIILYATVIREQLVIALFYLRIISYVLVYFYVYDGNNSYLKTVNFKCCIYGTDLMQRRVCMQARVVLLASASGTPRECEWHYSRA